MNILFAEDQRIIQMTHQLMMENWGFNCDIASNGAEAVALAKHNEGLYDLCIMDVSMPIMSGIEATNLIREQVRYFPILGYSTEINTREPCLQAGMDDFILKPSPQKQL